VEDYAALGEVREALARYMKTALRQFGREQPQARTVVKALATGEGTKRATFLEEIGARARTIGLDLADDTIAQNFLRRGRTPGGCEGEARGHRVADP
jgi:hypothetical protein